MIRASLILFLSVGSCNFCQGQFTQDINEIYELSKSRYTLVLRSLDSLSQEIENNPTLELYYHRAIIHDSINLYNEALADIDRCVVYDSSNAEFYFLRAAIFEKSNELKKAISAINKCIGLEPENGENFVERAYLKEKLRDKKGYCEDLKKADQLGALDTAYYKKECDKLESNTANTRQRFNSLKEYKKAARIKKAEINNEKKEIEIEIENLNREIQKSPENIDFYFIRTSLYSILSSRGKNKEYYQSAIRDLRICMNLDPTEKSFFEDSYLWHLDYENYEGALSDLNHLESIGSKKCSFYYDRAQLYEKMGTPKKACKDYQSALKANDCPRYIQIPSEEACD